MSIQTVCLLLPGEGRGQGEWKRVEHGWLLDCQQEGPSAGRAQWDVVRRVVRSCYKAGAARWDEACIGSGSEPSMARSGMGSERGVTCLASCPGVLSHARGV
ncbi:hypothetical protein CABS02_12594 [Colletotrichum abscissum]|uniref:Uncharacterized protein n=1 Tax=Colletotrichum abscissum TaxID=1671311 RepID=A0A9P9X4P2_9PEZI|nr:hypothetical protein CABS02_12594 [Colletotrichum abscissum]